MRGEGQLQAGGAMRCGGWLLRQRVWNGGGHAVVGAFLGALWGRSRMRQRTNRQEGNQVVCVVCAVYEEMYVSCYCFCRVK